MTMTRLLLLSALALVAGCSTPPDYYHTLRPAVAPAPTSARDAQRVLEIGPVTIPDSLARDEWVVRTGDTGAMVYDHQLWTQGLAADVAQSMVDYLNRGTLPDGLWADAGRYRVVRTAVRDAAEPAPAADAAVAEAQQRFDRVARAHSETVRLVAEDVAAALRASVAERAQTCIAGR